MAMGFLIWWSTQNQSRVRCETIYVVTRAERMVGGRRLFSATRGTEWHRNPGPRSPHARHARRSDRHPQRDRVLDRSKERQHQGRSGHLTSQTNGGAVLAGFPSAGAVGPTLGTRSKTGAGSRYRSRYRAVRAVGSGSKRWRRRSRRARHPQRLGPGWWRHRR